MLFLAEISLALFCKRFYLLLHVSIELHELVVETIDFLLQNRVSSAIALLDPACYAHVPLLELLTGNSFAAKCLLKVGQSLDS